MKLRSHFRLLPFLFAFSALIFSGCGKDDDSVTPDPNQTENPTGPWSGKLIHDWSSSIREYDFATKAEPELFDGRMPYRMRFSDPRHRRCLPPVSSRRGCPGGDTCHLAPVRQCLGAAGHSTSQTLRFLIARSADR